jgi:hypothetical protein
MLHQIGQCCSWQTADERLQVDYWSNANRPDRADGTSGGYGMYTVIDRDDPDARLSFTSKAAAFSEVRRRVRLRRMLQTA